MDFKNADYWVKKHKELEEKYYPLSWNINDGQIEIHCKDGKLLPLGHEIYDIEWNFIYEQINDYLLSSGEIDSI